MMLPCSQSIPKALSFWKQYISNTHDFGTAMFAMLIDLGVSKWYDETTVFSMRIGKW